MKANTVSIRLDRDLDRQLARLSRRSGRSRSDIVREALRRQLRLERFEGLRQRVMPFAEARLPDRRRRLRPRFVRVFPDANVLGSAVAVRGPCSDVMREVPARPDLVVSAQVRADAGGGGGVHGGEAGSRARLPGLDERE